MAESKIDYTGQTPTFTWAALNANSHRTRLVLPDKFGVWPNQANLIYWVRLVWSTAFDWGLSLKAPPFHDMPSELCSKKCSLQSVTRRGSSWPTEFHPRGTRGGRIKLLPVRFVYWAMFHLSQAAPCKDKSTDCAEFIKRVMDDGQRSPCISIPTYMKEFCQATCNIDCKYLNFCGLQCQLFV